MHCTLPGACRRVVPVSGSIDHLQVKRPGSRQGVYNVNTLSTQRREVATLARTSDSRMAGGIHYQMGQFRAVSRAAFLASYGIRRLGSKTRLILQWTAEESVGRSKSASSLWRESIAACTFCAAPARSDVGRSGGSSC